MATPSNERETRAVYDKIAESYSQLRKTNKQFYNEYLEMPATLSLLKHLKNKNLLDLGCGPGIYAKILQRRGAHVFGIDISDKMIEIAKRNNRNIDFRVGSGYDLPYDSSFFDVAVAALSLEHFADLDRVLKEVNRVMKRGGTFVFSIGNPVVAATHSAGKRGSSVRVFKNYFTDKTGVSDWKGFGVSFKWRRHTYEEWIKAIVRNGFSIVDYVDAKPDIRGKRVFPEMYRFALNIPYFSVFSVTKVK